MLDEHTTLKYQREFHPGEVGDSIRAKTLFTSVSGALRDAAKELEATRAVIIESKEPGETAETLQQGVKALDAEFKRQLDAYVRMQAARNALASVGEFSSLNKFTGEVAAENAQDNTTRRLDDVYRDARGEAMDAEMAKPQAERYDAARVAREYELFRQAIHDAGPDSSEPMPDMGVFYDDGDEEIVVEQARISYKCPLTRTWFDNPVTSDKCGHSFSHDAIMGVFETSVGNAIKCPIPACRHHFSRRNLKPNERLAREAAKAAATQARETQRQNRDLDKL